MTFAWFKGKWENGVRSCIAVSAPFGGFDQPPPSARFTTRLIVF